MLRSPATKTTQSIEVKMMQQKWFEEKTHQINPSSIMAFGIEIETRYAKAHELVELIMFAEEVTKSGANKFVEKATYDSNSCCCHFKLKTNTEQHSPQARTIFDSAINTIKQFEWFGAVHHGKFSSDFDFDK